MYQTINGWQRVTTWEEFKLTLQSSRLVSQKLRTYGKDMKKPCAYKLCGEIGHNHKEKKDEYPHNRRITKGVSRGSQGTSVGDCSQRFCCNNGSSVYIVGKDP